MATSRPIATRTVETCREGGNRMFLLATKIALTARRSAARMMISFTAAGQASASTKIFTEPRYASVARPDTTPPGARVPVKDEGRRRPRHGRKRMSRWTFEPGHTSAEFSARHMMVTDVRGHFKNVHGWMELDDADP